MKSRVRILASTRGYLRILESMYRQRYTHTRDMPFSSTLPRHNEVASYSLNVPVFSSIIHYEYCRNNCHPHEVVSFLPGSLVSLEKQISFFKLKYTGAALLGDLFSLFAERYIIKNATE